MRLSGDNWRRRKLEVFKEDYSNMVRSALPDIEARSTVECGAFVENEVCPFAGDGYRVVARSRLARNGVQEGQGACRIGIDGDGIVAVAHGDNHQAPKSAVMVIG